MQSAVTNGCLLAAAGGALLMWLLAPPQNEGVVVTVIPPGYSGVVLLIDHPEHRAPWVTADTIIWTVGRDGRLVVRERPDIRVRPYRYETRRGSITGPLIDSSCSLFPEDLDRRLTGVAEDSTVYCESGWTGYASFEFGNGWALSGGLVGTASYIKANRLAFITRRAAWSDSMRAAHQRARPTEKP